MHTLPSESFVRKFKTKLPEFLGGKELLGRLEQTGCGVTFILLFLDLYCGAQVESSRRDSIKNYESQKKSLGKELVKLSKRLTRASLEIEKINAKVAPQLARHGQEPFLLPDHIRAYVVQIVAASKEIGDVSLRTAPMDVLNRIADCMKKSIRGKIPYDDIALLLEIGYAAYGVTKILSPADVKRLIRRARARRVKQVEQRPIVPRYSPGFGRS